jgi:hypothetical protein
MDNHEGARKGSKKIAHLGNNSGVFYFIEQKIYGTNRVSERKF